MAISISTGAPSPENFLDRRLTWILLLGLCFIASLAVRVLASLNNFWLDEILSLTIAQSVQHPLDIVTKLHYDNSHPLNTFFMFLLGNQNNWLIYRVPALIAGSGAVVMAGLIGGLRGRLEALTFMILTGFSYLLIHYSSEARGYGLEFFFLLLSFYAALRYEADHRFSWTILFWVSSLLAILANLIYFYFYFALLIWSISLVITTRPPDQYPLRRLLQFYVFPALCFLGLYLVHLRHLLIRGGPEFPKSLVALGALTLAIGLPGSPLFMLAGIIFVFIACGYGWLILRRTGSNLQVFFIALIVLNYSFMLKNTYIRYFLCTIIFFYFLLSYVLADLYRRGLLGKILYVVLILGYILGNSLHTAHLVKIGRGGYLEALNYIASNSQGATISIGNDDDFYNKPVLDFYLNYLKTDKIIQCYSSRAIPQESPEWFIRHDFGQGNPAPKIYNGLNKSYTLVKSYPYAGLSGVAWYLYRRDPVVPTH